MRPPRCPRCDSFVFLDSLACPRCGTDVAFDHGSLEFVLLAEGGAVVEGVALRACTRRPGGCNWLAGTDDAVDQCLSCRLTRRRPDTEDDPTAGKLAETESAKRRLLIQLFRLGLPVEPYFDTQGGLAFDLLSSTSGQPVTTGHADGVITLDLAEALDDHRESLRVRFGEPYRTVLGHLRHEAGHYFQPRLVTDDDAWATCRDLFGDERADYSEALARHYAGGPPEGWEASYISNYATMHPWEDFAETFAHYLHITGTLTVASWSGIRLDARRFDGLLEHDITPSSDYRTQGMARMLEDWHWLSTMLNRVNWAMGQRDLYPFALTAPVVDKLSFVHQVVTGSMEAGTPT